MSLKYLFLWNLVQFSNNSACRNLNSVTLVKLVSHALVGKIFATLCVRAVVPQYLVPSAVLTGLWSAAFIDQDALNDELEG